MSGTLCGAMGLLWMATAPLWVGCARAARPDPSPRQAAEKRDPSAYVRSVAQQAYREAQRSYVALRFEDSLLTISRAQTALNASAPDEATEWLRHDLLLLAAMNQLALGRRDRAEAEVLRAVVLRPHAELDASRYPPEVRELHAAARVLHEAEEQKRARALLLAQPKGAAPSPSKGSFWQTHRPWMVVGAALVVGAVGASFVLFRSVDPELVVRAYP